MHWFERRPDRLAHERATLSNLQNEGWIRSAEWAIDNQAGTAEVDIDFEAGGQLRQATLVYPFIYPSAPPRLFPRGQNERWSNHQWGTGELCLQIRADNWAKSYDVSHILRSAKHLLDTEASVDDSGQIGVVPSEHRFTAGQLLRFSYARIVLSKWLIAELQRRDRDVFILDLRTSIFEETCVCLGAGISGSPKYNRWIDQTIPANVGEVDNIVGRIVCMEEGDKYHQALISSDMSCSDRWKVFSEIPHSGFGIIVGLLNGNIIAKYLGENHKIEPIIHIAMDNQQRTPDRNSDLVNKRVAIIGCGSMGSKVAISLARMGVSKFYLIDSDIFNQGNIVRNELDWGDVGAHKVDALSERIKLINPQADIGRWINHFGGQTTIDTLVLCLENLKLSNLIIDTTGSELSLLYTSGICEDTGIPMAWGRVFGGGFGGYIARSRPTMEAPAIEMRNEIYKWFQKPEHPEPPPGANLDYGAGPEDQPAMIADDADVSVISAHLTQFSADLLRNQTNSTYPHSAYVIGMHIEWIFKQPLEVHPIDLSKLIHTQRSDYISN